MKPEAVFKRYDIRGKHLEEIDEEFALRLGKAIGTLTQRDYSGEIVVSRDNKDSSRRLFDSLVEGIISTGTDVYNAGRGPTDFTSYTAQEMFEDAVAVQVTSSHLPLEYNGFKLMYPEGNGFLNEDLDRIEDLFMEKEFLEGNGEERDIREEARERYLDGLEEYAQRYFDSINRRIVVDTLGGATSGFLPEILERLGAEVIDLADEKEGEKPYRDPPEPSEENLQELIERVEAEDAYMGLATDMDGDRVAAYNNRILDGNEIFSIMAQIVPEGDVVASIDTSKMVKEVVEKQGEEILYTRVGDPFVIDEVIERDAVLGGEPNYHYCFPDFVPYNSGTLSAVLLAGSDTDELLEDVPEYTIRRENLQTEDKQTALKNIRERLDEDHIVSEKDGIKFEHEGSSVLVRPSGTEPVLRVISESDDSGKASRAISWVEQVIRNA